MITYDSKKICSKKCLLVVLIMLSVLFSSIYIPRNTPVSFAKTKTTWTAVYKINGRTVSYKNTRIIYESGNSESTGKMKKIKLSKHAKYYWFTFSEDGYLTYRKMNSKEFKKSIKNAADSYEYQICKFKIKNGKVVKIYGEYQA